MTQRPDSTHNFLSIALNRLSFYQLVLIFFVVAVGLQTPLLFNPGYFSHDELQWAALSFVSSFSELPWVSWWSIDDYQYRPLTFNLWLALSYHYFETPFVFHSILIIWSVINALLLLMILKHYNFSQSLAFAGGLTFLLSPYAVYVHGWVGTMADMLVMSSLLLLVILTLKQSRLFVILLLSSVLTAVALISKESAIVFPAVFAVAWLFDGFKKRWFICCFVTTLMVLIYLYIRLPILLQQPENTHYSLSILNAPVRWLEYYLYWIMPNTIEPMSTLPSGLHTTPIVAGLLLIGLVIILFKINKKLTLAFFSGGLACLLPVLPISTSYTQYGYLFSAWTISMLLIAWQHSKPWQRRYLLLIAFLCVYHGFSVMKVIHNVGSIQSVFTPALVEITQEYKDKRTIRLKVNKDSDLWIYKRLTHHIPSHLGRPLGDRFEFVTDPSEADHLILDSGMISKIKNK
jgi:ABC-type multidrug transport system fused ATPase/permease subunit